MSPEHTSQATSVWTDRLDRFRTADMSVAQFCNAEGVSLASYYYWRKKLHGKEEGARKKSPEALRRFVPVALADRSPDVPATVMAIELPGGIRIRFEVAGDPRENRT